MRVFLYHRSSTISPVRPPRDERRFRSSRERRNSPAEQRQSNRPCSRSADNPDDGVGAGVVVEQFGERFNETAHAL